MSKTTEEFIEEIRNLDDKEIVDYCFGSVFSHMNMLQKQVDKLVINKDEPTIVKQDRYKREDGTDTIDKWAARYPPEIFRIIMWIQMEKYQDRLGKKSPIVEEVGKIQDYANRWLQYEIEQEAIKQREV